ncbi:unnamed protein product [Rhizophagus irregularis]|nr:unnamed protein product [Rhizophagus irregularis]
MSEREDTVHSPSERKRSLPSDDEEDDLSSDERGGRFKRPALNTSGGEDDNSSELDYTDEPPAEERPVTPSETGDVMEVNVRSPAAAEKEKVETESTLATISLRALVTTKEAGVIIGKGGKNVSEIRDRSGAKVTISEMVQGAYERILTVTGPLDTVAKAFALVARKILDENLDTPSTPNSKSTTIRLLVPHSRMGPVIEMLPQSTERTISISGVPDSIHIAVFHVGEELAKHQNDRPTGITPYRPQPRLLYHQAAPVAGSPFYVGLPPGPPHYGRDFMPGPPPINHQPPPGSQAQQIFIPNDM